MRTLVALTIATAIALTPAHAQSGGNPSACAPSKGVSADSVRAIASRTHPEMHAPANRDSSVIVGLIFDSNCHLKEHAVGHRKTDSMTADTALVRLFPTFKPGTWTSSGFAGDSNPHPGEPWIVWAVLNAKSGSH